MRQLGRLLELVLEVNTLTLGQYIVCGLLCVGELANHQDTCCCCRVPVFRDLSSVSGSTSFTIDANITCLMIDCIRAIQHMKHELAESTA
jgi:hypothetical protein